MSFEKYRVHEVAKDFGKQTKDITQILTTYATTPKNHMQVLDDKELSIIFEYLTQHNQVADLQAVFANAPKAGKAPKTTAPGTTGTAAGSRASRSGVRGTNPAGAGTARPGTMAPRNNGEIVVCSCAIFVCQYHITHITRVLPHHYPIHFITIPQPAAISFPLFIQNHDRNFRTCFKQFNGMLVVLPLIVSIRMNGFNHFL